MDAYNQCSARADKRECVFDRMMGFEGAYKLLKTEGQPALEAELSRRGMSNKAKSIDLATTAQRLEDSIQRRKMTGYDVERGGSSRQDIPDTPIDESLLIEDDAERLAAKANKLGVSEQAHARLRVTLSVDQLDRVYNRAGAHHAPPSNKAMPDEERDALLYLQAKPLLPEPVMDALERELGNSLFQHILEDLRLSLVFGPHLVPKAYAPPQRATINHPTFGPMKEKAAPQPGTHPTFGVAYKIP